MEPQSKKINVKRVLIRSFWIVLICSPFVWLIGVSVGNLIVDEKKSNVRDFDLSSTLTWSGFFSEYPIIFVTAVLVFIWFFLWLLRSGWNINNKLINAYVNFGKAIIVLIGLILFILWIIRWIL